MLVLKSPLQVKESALDQIGELDSMQWSILIKKNAVPSFVGVWSGLAGAIT